MIGDRGFDITTDAYAEVGRREALRGVCRCVLSQIERPYPCSERQTLTCAEDLELPRNRFPAFYGSFDWHSCVHSHWTLVRMLKDNVLTDVPELEKAAAAQLSRTFAPDLMEQEARSSYDPNPCQAAMRSRNRSFRGFLSCNGCGIFGECRCGRVLQHETCGHPCPFSYPRIPCICTARTSMFRLGGGGTVWMRACRHGRCIQFQASLPPGSRARRARAQRHSWSGE